MAERKSPYHGWVQDQGLDTERLRRVVEYALKQNDHRLVGAAAKHPAYDVSLTAQIVKSESYRVVLAWLQARRPSRAERALLLSTCSEDVLQGLVDGDFELDEAELHAAWERCGKKLRSVLVREAAGRDGHPVPEEWIEWAVIEGTLAPAEKRDLVDRLRKRQPGAAWRVALSADRDTTYSAYTNLPRRHRTREVNLHVLAELEKTYSGTWDTARAGEANECLLRLLLVDDDLGEAEPGLAALARRVAEVAGGTLGSHALKLARRREERERPETVLEQITDEALQSSHVQSASRERGLDQSALWQRVARHPRLEPHAAELLLAGAGFEPRHLEVVLEGRDWRWTRTLARHACTSTEIEPATLHLLLSKLDPDDLSSVLERNGEPRALERLEAAGLLDDETVLLLLPVQSISGSSVLAQRMMEAAYQRLEGEAAWEVFDTLLAENPSGSWQDFLAAVQELAGQDRERSRSRSEGRPSARAGATGAEPSTVPA